MTSQLEAATPAEGEEDQRLCESVSMWFYPNLVTINVMRLKIGMIR